MSFGKQFLCFFLLKMMTIPRDLLIVNHLNLVNLLTLNTTTRNRILDWSIHATLSHTMYLTNTINWFYTNSIIVWYSMNSLFLFYMFVTHTYYLVIDFAYLVLWWLGAASVVSNLGITLYDKRIQLCVYVCVFVCVCVSVPHWIFSPNVISFTNSLEFSFS